MAEENFGGATMTHSGSNCKLSYVEYMSSILYACNGLDEKAKIQKFKNFFRKGRIVVSINVTDENLKNFIEKNFETYSISKIPVGYSSGYQWSINLRNVDTVASNANYMRAVETPKKEVATTEKEKIEKILTKVLKAKRRKTDIVKDVMANL